MKCTSRCPYGGVLLPEGVLRRRRMRGEVEARRGVVGPVGGVSNRKKSYAPEELCSDGCPQVVKAAATEVTCGGRKIS